MALVKEKYSVNGINRIYYLLKNEAENGAPKDYDIKVDAMKVVSRNNNPERFFEHEHFLLENTKSITINIYDGASPRCMKYTLLLQEEEPNRQELSGIEKSFNARMQQEKKEWEHVRTKQENAELREQLEQKEKYAAQLEEHITNMRSEREQMPNKLTNALVSLAGAYFSNDSQGFNGAPFLNNLLASSERTERAADEEGQPEKPTQKTGEEEEYTFSRINDLQYTGNITDEDIERFDNSLIPLFSEQYRKTVSTVVQFMYHNNNVIQEIADLLEQPQPEQQQAA